MGSDEDALFDEDGYPIGHSTDNPGQFTSRPKGAPPPSGPGWRRVWEGKSKNYDEYYRDPAPPKDGKPPSPQTSSPAKPSPPRTPVRRLRAPLQHLREPPLLRPRRDLLAWVRPPLLLEQRRSTRLKRTSRGTKNPAGM